MDADAARMFVEACLRQNDQEAWEVQWGETTLGDWPPMKWACFTRKGHDYGTDMYHGCVLSQAMYHGCVLSQAHSILKTGFRVGPGTHCHNGRSCTGLFGFTGGTLRSALRLASDRVDLERCTEAQLGGKIGGWGVPVVLRISRPEPIVRLHMVGECYKSVWESKRGSQIQLGEIAVYVPIDRLRRFNDLAKEPALTLKKHVTCADLGHRMLCGGKWCDVQYGQKIGHPTCGRLMDYDSLHTNGWKKGGGSGMWHCPECYAWLTIGDVAQSRIHMCIGDVI